ncbi:MAG: type 4a pilus biogenesis protein PilO [Parcubacteria group bacterium]|nr:type 4a pilus biogenesis protein PilO [Candidatus Liptonbacteria bacterium]MBI3020085.1 type 4a pilus biogenesis protein PilO [Parcubacteria group bacterium]
MRYIISAILIAVSAAVFFLFTDPIYQETKALKQQISVLDETFSNSRRIQEVRDTLFGKFNAIPEADLARLEKILPNNVDNVKLILELDRIASQRGMDIKRIDVQEAAGEAGGLGPSGLGYGELDIGLTLTGSYAAFRGFLADLEQSLRLVDITELNFRAAGFDFDQYNVTVRTYWLR